MAWTDYYNEYGLSLETPIANAQNTGLQTSTQYANGGVSAGLISGSIVNALQVPANSNGNIGVTIDSNGIYAGSSVFSSANFSVDLTGSTVFQSSNAKIAISPTTNNIIFYTNSVPTIVIQG